MAPRPTAEALADRRAEITRALKRYHARLARKVEALRGDLAEAQRAAEFRTFAT
jgi:5,10-methylenetetrahydrofolate reductase